jgi:hypothetical protein
MTDPTAKHMPARILVFLPEAAVSIVAKLNEEGYVAIHVASQADLEGNLAVGGYDLIVTTRPNIDIVRRVRPLPVVNIEVFLNVAQVRAMSEAGSHLDMVALSRRINALVDRRSAPTAVPTTTKRRSCENAMMAKLTERIRAISNRFA